MSFVFLYPPGMLCRIVTRQAILLVLCDRKKKKTKKSLQFFCWFAFASLLQFPLTRRKYSRLLVGVKNQNTHSEQIGLYREIRKRNEDKERKLKKQIHSRRKFRGKIEINKCGK